MPVSRRTNPHARRLRREATDVERRCWLAVRHRRLGGFKFRRQATIGRRIVDFLCVECRLGIELDGGQLGDHRDDLRTLELNDAGVRVLRFWNNDVLANLPGVLETVLAALTTTVEPPSPNPLPPAGEGLPPIIDLGPSRP